MGIITEAAKTLKRIVDMDERVSSLERRMERSLEGLIDHEKRLIRIETIIEMGLQGGGRPRLDE